LGKSFLQVDTDPQPSSGHYLLSSASEDTDSNPEEFIPSVGVSSHNKTKCKQFALNLDRDDWIKELIPHADRGKLSTADIFYFCAATIQVGGGNLDDIQLSTETIRRIRAKTEDEAGSTIRDQFVFPDHLVAHFDGERRKQRGQIKDFLAVCVTGSGMDKEKLLGDIPISDGTGKQIAENVLKLLQEWKLKRM